jgi:hypothetical protein
MLDLASSTAPSATLLHDDTVSTVSGATATATLTWTVEFHNESDGRITVSLNHTALGHRPPESLVRFARGLAAAVKASAGATLELNGVSKPLAKWKRSSADPFPAAPRASS